MIQVIGRAFNMLELISRNEWMRMTDLAKGTGLGKTTAGNILATLRDLGYLAQNDKSEYGLSDKFQALAATKISKNIVAKVAEENVRFLAADVSETVVLAVLVNGERYKLAEANPDRTITVNTAAYQGGCLFDTVTGRILLAHLNAKELRGIMKRYDFPHGRQWAGVTTQGELYAVLEKIRTDGIHIITMGDLIAVGVPVYEADTVVWGAIGVYLPKSRFTRRHRAEIIRGLKGTAERIRHQLFRNETTPLAKNAEA